jgi:glycosyltransferase involved in cell wall biosynthesis
MRSEAAVCCVVPDAGRLKQFPTGSHVHDLNCGSESLRAHPLIGEVHDCPPADRSEQVRRALEVLDREHGFAEIHFPSLGGLAFRTIQTKQAGLAFENAEIVIHDNGTSRAIREANHSWPAGPDDLAQDFMEEFSASCAPLRGPRVAAKRSVTVGIAHYNLGRYLPEALESLANQTYTDLEVIVVDDGSTQPDSIAVVDALEKRYPAFRFIRQANAGIGATRNRLLAEAKGEFFIPMDADNIAKPDMVSSFVRAMNLNPHLAAMTCWFLAFNDDSKPGEFLYAHRPTGGPHALACIRNVYGDANGIFRTAEFRAVGGYETDRGTSCEDWEAYVKLVHAGKRIGVVPEYLFHYRHREAGFSRATNWFANHQRVMRQFDGEQWAALLGFQQENLRLRELLNAPRHRIADTVHKKLAWPWKWLKRRVVNSS